MSEEERAIVVYGASGHGLAIAMVLQGQSTYPVSRRIAAFIDDTPELVGKEHGGIPVVSFDDWRRAFMQTPCFVSSGKGKVRKLLVDRILAAGGFFECVYPNVRAPYEVPRIGFGSIVAQFVFVGPNVTIGNHVQVMPMTSLGHDVAIGDFATVCPGCTISGHVRIEEGAFIGAGATVLNGKPSRPITIGRDSVVGAGSVVTKSVSPGSTVSGNPAESLRERAAGRRRHRSESS